MTYSNKLTCIVLASLLTGTYGCTKKEKTSENAGKTENTQSVELKTAPGDSTPKDSKSLEYQSNLSSLAGKSPFELIDKSPSKEFFNNILGSNRQLVIDRLDVWSEVRRHGDWLFAEGMAEHQGGENEAALSLNIKTAQAYAAILIDGKQIAIYGAKSPDELPPPLATWYSEHGGQPTTKMAATPPSKTTERLLNQIAENSHNARMLIGIWDRVIALNCHEQV